MRRPQIAAALWLIAGLAMIAAGLLSTPRRLLPSVAGVLFFAVAIMTLRRSREP